MTQQTVDTRPTLLTILCILSFIGLGLGIFNGLSGILFGTASNSFQPFIEEAYEEALHEMDMEDLPESAENFVINLFDVLLKAIENISLISLLSVLAHGLALAGVIMMWNMSRRGFYIYTAGKAIYLLIPFTILGFNIITALFLISSGFFITIFIILYAINLKYLK